MSDFYQNKIFISLAGAFTGIVTAHPLLVLKTNTQVIGGNIPHLYAGVGLYIIKSLPASATSFYLLQHPYFSSMDPWIKGITTRLISETLFYPIGLWSTQKQIGQPLSGFFRGWGPTIIRDIAFSGIFMSVYEHPSLLGYNGVIKGMIAGSTASITTQALDWWKVKNQTNLKMNNVWTGWKYRLAYCNIRSAAAWGIFEYLRQKN